MATDASEQVDARSQQRVVVMRHGERLDNVDPSRWDDMKGDRAYDPPLSELGVEECKETASERLKDKGVTMVISSPFIRCLQTAQEACKALGLPGVTISNSLCEVLDPIFGVDKLPIVPAPDVATHGIEILEQDDEPLPKYPEDFSDCFQRYEKGIKKIANQHYPNNLLLVTHAYGVEQAMVIGGKEPRSLRPARYCAYVELMRDSEGSKWRVESMFRGVSNL